jgi:hypothetical protein
MTQSGLEGFLDPSSTYAPAEGGRSAAADQQVGFHRILAFDLDGTARLEMEVSIEGL